MQDCLQPRWVRMEWNHWIRGITIPLFNASSSLGWVWHTIEQPSIMLLKYQSGYWAVFVASLVTMFCCVCIQSSSTVLFSVMVGNGILRKHLSKSRSLLMLRPWEVKSKRTIGAFPSTGIGDTSQWGSHKKFIHYDIFLARLIEDSWSILIHIQRPL